MPTMKDEPGTRVQSINWEDVFRAISDPAMILDTNWRIIAVNPATLKATGLREDELAGKRCHEVIHHLGHPPRGCPLETLLRSPSPGVMEMEVEILGGVYLITIAPILDEEGKVFQVLHVAKDVTEFRRAQEQLQEVQTTLRTLYEFHRALIRARDEEALLQELCNILLDVGGYRMAWVGYPCKGNGGFVRPMAFAGHEEGYLEFVRITVDEKETGRGPTGRAFRTNRPAVCRDISKDPGFAPWRKEALRRGYASSISIPVLSERECLGTINIYAGEPNRFGEEETELLCKLAEELAYGIVSLRAKKAREEAERALALSEEKYRRLVETANDAILLADVQTGIILDANKKAEDLLGLPAEKIRGIHHTEIHPPEERERYQEIFKTHASANGVISEDLWVVNKDGRRIPVQVSASTFTLGDRKILQGIFRDMTERRLMEERLRQSQKLEAIGTLARGIAHDFNNILVPILGYAELAKAYVPQNDKLHFYLAEITKATDRARDLVKQILTFSRRGEDAARPLLLHPLVKETIKFLRSILPSTIEIHAHLDPDAGPVFCNPTHMHQVLMNLCTNAYQAMEETGGIMEIMLEAVVLESSTGEGLDPGRYVRLSVKDTGPGMDQETLNRIFEPYFTTKPVDKGTGLGLAVVHGIIGLYGGHIHVYSRVGHGTTFEIYLPEQHGAKAAAAQGPVDEPDAKGSEMILLVDDEEGVVRVTARLLRELGYRVSPFTSSTDALEAFSNAPGSYDMVMTDQTMPGMPGSELARRVLEIRPGIPVVLLSGYNSVLSPEEAEAMGIKAVLMKPLSLAELSRVVRRTLDGR